MKLKKISQDDAFQILKNRVEEMSKEDAERLAKQMEDVLQDNIITLSKPITLEEIKAAARQHLIESGWERLFDFDNKNLLYPENKLPTIPQSIYDNFVCGAIWALTRKFPENK